MSTKYNSSRTFTWMALFTIIAILPACSGDTDVGSDTEVDARTAPYGSVSVEGQAAPAVAAPAVAAPVEAAEEAVATASPAPAVTAAAEIDGKALYAPCMACHLTGVMDAPKLGDTAAWAPRIAAGMDTLMASAINGKTGKSGAMPPRGATTYSDEQLKAVVEYMVNSSQ